MVSEMELNLKSIRDMLVLGIVGFGLLITLYVSVPDFPYNAPAWEVMSWGESTQWWCEITWITLFCVFSIFSLYLLSWNHEVKGNKSERYWLKVFRVSWLITTISVTAHFSIVYFKWTTWEGFFINDNTGYLHGVFYLLTFFVGLLVFGEGMSYLSKLHRHILKLEIRSV